MNCKELVSALSAQLNFDRYRLHAADCSLAETAQLLSLPEDGAPCSVRRARNRSGSAYEQQRQPGLVVGYMRSGDGSIKVLVIYTEQPDDAEPIGFSWGFVGVEQVQAVHTNVLAKDVAKRIRKESVCE